MPMGGHITNNMSTSDSKTLKIQIALESNKHEGSIANKTFRLFDTDFLGNK